MLLNNARLAVKSSKFDHDEINIHSSTMPLYGRHIALRGRLAALGFTPLFTRVERLSAGLTLNGGASAAGMGTAGMGAAGIAAAGIGAAGMGAARTGPTGMGAEGMGAGGGKPTVAGRPSQNSPRPGYCGLA